ncbi:unnamed protein product [Rhizophagus irregularis]|nr:unnamed protein product [Rhizophagus irregularis]
MENLLIWTLLMVFIPAPNYLPEYGPKLLGVLLIIILLVIFYFLANKEKERVTILLYIPSLIFYTVPIGLNMASTFLIMAKKYKK